MVAAPRLGHTVIEAEGLKKSFGERKVLDGVDFRLQRGERVGFLGPNGVGKTTFLRVMLGEIPADDGKLVIGKNTKVAYYDQQRTQLDPDQTVYDAASNGEDHVELADRKVALRDYLEDLLFPVPMQRMKVGALSGGERNRLLLARLFLEGANVLVLDEPTNDLDIVTLNILERLLLDFAGSTLLVTHDRYFLDKVATAILSFDGQGKVTRYEGNYDMYKRLREQSQAAALKAAPKKDEPKKDEAREEPAAKPAQKKPGKLSYKDQRELDGMEATIEAAEQRKAGLEAQLADPTVYSNGSKVAEVNQALEAITAEVDRLYSRWQELQDLAAGTA